MAAVPGAVCRPVRRGQLNADHRRHRGEPVGGGAFAYATDPTHFCEWQTGVVFVAILVAALVFECVWRARSGTNALIRTATTSKR
jgi:hypothetical protein